jgi:hypothetical protein
VLPEYETKLFRRATTYDGEGVFLDVCGECGDVVGDRAKHDQFHSHFALVASQAHLSHSTDIIGGG